MAAKKAPVKRKTTARRKAQPKKEIQLNDNFHDDMGCIWAWIKLLSIPPIVFCVAWVVLLPIRYYGAGLIWIYLVAGIAYFLWRRWVN